jgi:hypothetical protein
MFYYYLKKSQKHKLLLDNEQEDKEISRLEKLLHIKKGSKKYKQVFYDEGFSDLLDFCDEEKRKEIVKTEGHYFNLLLLLHHHVFPIKIIYILLISTCILIFG